jgi:hypothetical protein
MAELNLDGFPENLWAATVTIKKGASESEAIATQGRTLCTVFMPDAWTTANIAVKAGLTINTLIAANANLKSSNAVVSTYAVFPTLDSVFAPYISIQSVDGVGAVVNQEADRVLTLLFRRFVS